MRLLKVVEMGEQTLGPLLHRKRFEHVLPDELGQASDRFHRHRLVEEGERLLVQTESLPKLRGVRWIPVVGQKPLFAQLLLESRDVGSEVREVCADRESFLGNDI